VLLVLFLTQVSGSLFPLEILKPAWQLRFATGLISSAPIALVGLALHKLASASGPRDHRLSLDHQRLAHLALLAAVGFLLLIPLQSQAILRQAATVQSAQVIRIQNAELRLAAMRRLLATASGAEELNRNLQQLNGPVLSPTDLAQPLPLLKAQVSAVLDQAALQIRRERQINPPLRRSWLIPDLFRNAIANLALAFGFASLSRRRGSRKSPLQEIQDGWKRRNRYRAAKLKSPLDPLLNLIDWIRVALKR